MKTNNKNNEKCTGIVPDDSQHTLHPWRLKMKNKKTIKPSQTPLSVLPKSAFFIFHFSFFIFFS